MTNVAATAGAALLSAFLTLGAGAAATPALAQDVDVQVRVGNGYGDDDYGIPPRHAYRHGGGYKHGYGYHGYGPPRYGWGHRRAYYVAPPVYVAPPCSVRVVRYYDDYEDAYVTKRVRRCW